MTSNSEQQMPVSPTARTSPQQQNSRGSEQRKIVAGQIFQNYSKPCTIQTAGASID